MCVVRQNRLARRGGRIRRSYNLAGARNSGESCSWRLWRVAHIVANKKFPSTKVESLRQVQPLELPALVIRPRQRPGITAHIVHDEWLFETAIRIRKTSRDNTRLHGWQLRSILSTLRIPECILEPTRLDRHRRARSCRRDLRKSGRTKATNSYQSKGKLFHSRHLTEPRSCRPISKRDC